MQQRTRGELAREAFGDIKRHADPIDLIQLAKNLPFEDRTKLSSTLTKEQLEEAMNVKWGGDFLWTFIKTVGRWPLFGSYGCGAQDEVSMRELVVCHVVLQGGLKELQVEVSMSQLVWIAMVCFHDGESGDSTAIDDKGQVDVIVDTKGKTQWGLLPMVQSFDGVELGPVTREAFAQMVATILPLHAYFGSGEGTVVASDQLAQVNFKAVVNAIVEGYMGGEETLSYGDFARCLKTLTPRLFEPLSTLLTPLVQVEIAKSGNVGPEQCGKIVTSAVFCEVNCITHLSDRSHLLFQGSAHGFSMRAMESHIFKYKAPTLLLLRGRVKEDFDKYKSGFWRTFPSGSGNSSVAQVGNSSRKRIVTLALHICEPWKVTNGAAFSTSGCQVYELQPRLRVENTQLGGVGLKGAYFTTNGMGLGVGVPHAPIVSKVAAGEGVKFGERPVGSVTIDNALEYANYRSTVEGDTWLKVLEVEVLALGRDQDLRDQEEQWKWEKREADRRKYIANREESRALLELAGLVGGAGQSGGSI